MVVVRSVVRVANVIVVGVLYLSGSLVVGIVVLVVVVLDYGEYTGTNVRTIVWKSVGNKRTPS